MTSLWLAIGALTVLVLGLVLPPLLRRRAPGAERADYDLTVFRDQINDIDRDLERGLVSAEQADALRTEIQRRILALADRSDGSPENAQGGGGRVLAIGIAGVMPLAAFLLYLDMGSPEQPGAPAADRRAAPQPSVADGGDPAQAPGMEAMLDRLAERMRRSPDDPDGWLLLARSYLSMKRYADAAAAFEEAWTRLDGDDRHVVGIDFAEALVIADGGRVGDRAAGLLRDGRASDPTHPKPRFYLANRKAQNGDLAGALRDLIDIRAIGPEGAPWMNAVEQMIGRVAGDSGIDPATVAPTEDAIALGREVAESARPDPVADSPGPTREDMRQAAEMTPEERTAMIRGMVEGLALRLEANPDDLAGWRRLARAYRVLGETGKAEAAEARIRRLLDQQ